MNDSCSWGAVAIDTNVFEHVFHPDENRARHIDKTLEYLQNDNTKLLVDTKSKIHKEYLSRLDRLLRKSERNHEISVLRYWLAPETQEKVDVVEQSELMNAIKGVIQGHSANTDRTFIYVAFFRGKNLISNDRDDIVVGPTPELGLQERRHRLKQATKRVCKPSQQSRIMTSLEAYNELETEGQNQS